MGAQRAHIVVPSDLLADIDSEVGPRGRSAFFSELARQEINRRKLLAMLTRKEPMWKEEDHPEMAGPGGVERWVRALRDESDKRVDRAVAAWNE